MKRTFPIIIGLITLSLIGIIYIQISWLKNMMILREDQLEDKIGRVTEAVSKDLAQYKSTPPVMNKKFNGFDDDVSTSEFFKPYLVGSRFTSQEIYQKRFMQQVRAI